MSSRPANLSFFFEPSEETEDNEVTKLSASSFIRNFVDKLKSHCSIFGRVTYLIIYYGAFNFSFPNPISIPTMCHCDSCTKQIEYIGWVLFEEKFR